jgi:hypothetical protein
MIIFDIIDDPSELPLKRTQKLWLLLDLDFITNRSIIGSQHLLIDQSTLCKTRFLDLLLHLRA